MENPIPKISATPWERRVGDKIEKIRSEDVMDAIDASMSLILKETSFNDSIKDNPKALYIYNRHRDVLGILKSRFEDMFNAMPREPKKTIPSRRFYILK